MSFLSPLAEHYPAGTRVTTIGDSETAASFAPGADDYGPLRERAAVLDLSSVGLLEVSGGDAEAFLEGVLARDVRYLSEDRSMMTLILDEKAGPVDLVVVYAVAEGFLLETSFGRGTATKEFLESLVEGDVTVRDRRDDLTAIGLEGPFSWSVVGEVIDDDLIAIPYESVIETEWQGAPIRFARNGYSGEYGYKVHCDHKTAQALWNALLAHCPPAGLDAVEIAMLEIRQPVLHLEVEPGDSAIPCGFAWLTDPEKADYVGRDALVADFEADNGLRTVGFLADIDELPNRAADVFIADQRVGHVVHAVVDPGLGKVLGLARVPARWATASLEFGVALPSGDTAVAATVSSPYRIPKSWTTPIL